MRMELRCYKTYFLIFLCWQVEFNLDIDNLGKIEVHKGDKAAADGEIGFLTGLHEGDPLFSGGSANQTREEASSLGFN